MKSEREKFLEYVKKEYPLTYSDLPDCVDVMHHFSREFKAWQAAKAEAVPECKWSQDEDGVFHTNCGNSFIFSEPDFTPKNNGFKNCCYCGGLIESQEKESGC